MRFRRKKLDPPIRADFSKIPAPLTPREAALSSGFQDVIREVLLQLEQGGFRIA